MTASPPPPEMSPAVTPAVSSALSSGPSLELLPAAGRAATPWRNGSGITREIACGTGGPLTGGFDWRISVAEVATDGPFSEFVGVQRTIVLIAGAAMTLTIDGVDHVLGLYQPLTFDGASRTVCTLPGGPTRDLNLMTTVGRAQGTVEVIRLDGSRPVLVPGGAPLVLVGLAGQVLATAPQSESTVLDPLDALSWASRDHLTVAGPAVVAVVRIEVC